MARGRWAAPEPVEMRTVKRRERRAPANPKGIVTSSPRLARQRLPWVIGKQIINRNAVVANVAREGRIGMAATALPLEVTCGR
jgi:hypothetical protein